MNNKVIDLHNVSKTFGGAKALNNVDFDLLKGEVHCLIGQNGCGKSTLIKIIAGVLEQDSRQEVKIDGVSVIYQDLSLFPNLTVAENIYFPLYKEKGRLKKKALTEKAKESLERLHVDLELDTKIEDLPVADRQLVAIARAIVTQSDILIMDEPTSSLTPNEVKALFAIVSRLKQEGVSVIFVSHKLDEIVEIADRITIMRDGEMVKTVNNGEVDIVGLSYLISGEEINLQKFEKSGRQDILLEVKQLKKRGQFEDISFTLERGEILGITGKLGAGRTELALSIFGMNRRDDGEILLEGKPVDFQRNREAINSGIAYVPEDRILQGVAIDQPVALNLTSTVLNKFKGKVALLAPKKLIDCTKKWISELEIKSARPDMAVSGLSGGNQQKVVLAKWLETHPKVLILDQPTNGIDIGAKSSIYTLIKKLAGSGMGIILISDEPQEIYYNCNKMIIMDKGRMSPQIDLTEMPLSDFEERIKHGEQEIQ